METAVARAKSMPTRSCVACGRRASKQELVRIVRTLEGTVEVDPAGKKAGRGTYLCRMEECWQQGLNKSRLDHSLRHSLAIADKEGLRAYYQEHLKPTLLGENR